MRVQGSGFRVQREFGAEPEPDLNARPEIHVGCQKRLTEVGFYVRDTGIGIRTERR